MKKIIILLIGILTITGCHPKPSHSLIEYSEYYLTYEEIDIKLGTFFTNILATIGEYNNVRKEQSSYAEGLASIYEFDTFEIETYMDNNIEKIYSIAITSNEQETNEGIKIGDELSKMKAIYGSDYTNPLENIFVYHTENTNLSFIAENDIIVGIIYYLV